MVLDKNIQIIMCTTSNNTIQIIKQRQETTSKMSMYCGAKVNVDRLVITVTYKGKQADVVNKLTCKTMDVKKRCADECRCDK